MGLDMIIPFGILLVLVIYLIYSRSKFEKEVVEVYEGKFEEWKKTTSPQEEVEPQKELVGLVFKKGYKLNIELIDEDLESKLLSGKFTTSSLKDK